MKRLTLLIAVLVFIFLLTPAALAVAEDPDPVNPDTVDPDTETQPEPEEDTSTLSDYFPFNLIGEEMTLEDSTTTIEIMILLTILTLAPSILIMVTAFTRIIIVLSFTRNAMGTQQMPPNQVMIGLALFLTFMVMFPVFSEIKTEAWDPYAAGEEGFGIEELLDNSIKPIRLFMHEQIRLQKHEADLANFIELARLPMPNSFDDIPTYVLIPAFITSEIKTGFIIGFMIYLPFIVIDMVVASALMSMGMMMLPPVMISLPFKIMVFVLVDGWNLTIKTLVNTFYATG